MGASGETNGGISDKISKMSPCCPNSPWTAGMTRLVPSYPGRGRASIFSPQSVAGPDVELVEGLGLAEMVQRDLVRLVVDSKVIAAYYEAFSRTKVEHSP